ncbi:pre-mRNA-splicing factor 38 [Tanacetum coccineum]
MADGRKYYHCERFLLELWLFEVYVPFPCAALLIFLFCFIDMLEYSLTHVDEVIDELLTKDYSCDIALPRIKKRLTIEAIGALEPRKSALEDDFEEEEEKDEDDQHIDTDVGGHEKDRYRE